MIVDRTTTAIVVDSTADLPDYLANDPSITTVPLTVYFGEEALLDWVDLKPEEFYDRLQNGPVLPRTSQPSAGAFLDVYKALREKYERVYSVHLSGKFSGTVASAEVAAGPDRRHPGGRLGIGHGRHRPARRPAHGPPR